MSHVSWVQQLARRLASDAHQAEDVAQESLLAALDRAALREPRRFFARVAKNLVYLDLRRRERRERREAAVARGEATPSALDVVERESTHALVVEAVQSLAPRYRQVLLMRYFDDQTPTEIATRLGIPVSTVKTRLTRAQAQVRDRLDRLHGGDGKSWLAALAPLLVRWPRMRWLAWSASAVLVLLAAFVVPLWWAGPQTTSLDRSVARGAMPRGAAPVPVAPGDEVIAPTETPRTAVPDASRRVAPTIDGALQPGLVVRGQVLDARGVPVPSVLVRMRPYREGGASGERITTSDADGRFSFARFWPGGTAEVVAPRWTTLLAGETRHGDPTAEVVVVVAPRAELQGQVVDAHGQAVAGALWAWEPPPDFRARFARGVGRSTTMSFAMNSDDAGRIVLSIPRVEGALLRVSKPGFEPAVANVANHGAFVVVSLARSAAGAAAMPGRVFDAVGQPLGGALVSNGASVRATRDDGSFELEVGPDTEQIVAWSPAHGAALLAAGSGAARWPAHADLYLAPASVLRGRVVDSDSRGVPGVHVWLRKPTPGGRDGERVAEVERMLASAPRSGPHAVSGSDGRFELRGMLGRSYRLVALDPGSLVSAESVFDPRRAEAAQLTLDLRAVHDLLRGRVLDDAGQAVRGAEICFGVTAGDGASEALLSSVVRSGPDGSFLLRGVPRHGAFVEVRGTSVLRQRVPAAPAAVGALTVDRAARLRVEMADGQDAVFRVFDAQGRPLRLERFRGQTRASSWSGVLRSGRSEVVAVSARAARVAAYRENELEAETSVSLPVGELTVVRLGVGR